MEHRNNDDRRETGGNDQKRDRQPPTVVSKRSQANSDVKDYEIARDLRPQGPPAIQSVTSWVNWQSALYVFVLGLMCVFLVPLTSFWWIVPVLGAAVPIALAVLDRPGLKRGGTGDKKTKEQELLHVLAERGEITPATAAMHTPLTVDEVSKMLDELARKGHLRPQAEDGIMIYTLRERDRYQSPGDASSPPETESKSDEASRQRRASQHLEDPLSERELEVLALLASGRTNSEVARDLFVSVGTVKSHTGNIYRKLGAKNRAEALARARELELLP